MTKPPDPATDPTLASRGADVGSAPTVVPAASRASEPTISGSGYAVGELLGRGGMGEVLVARDRRIGRDVAIKRMRSASPTPDALARFLREARIQARLEHPAVVPVHELGYDAEGRPFFTMKRLAGTTLAAVLSEGKGQQQQLLRTFIDVCLAIEFAHTRGVVHRDLKPANIMMGDFGEVYVLDWGVARVTDDDAPPDEPDVPSLEGDTMAGSLLGTPGYMAPEQVRGELVDPRADVYALGCILFEILAHEPLHPRSDTLASTLSRPTDSPAKRAAMEVAPELDTACIAALAAHPAERPTARELATRIQRYLDGDRDTERRRQLAAEEVARCSTALATGDRTTAMQSAGRALALDPESRDAARLVTSLVLEPPAELPEELDRHLDALDHEQERKQWRLATIAFSVFLPFAPAVIWQGVINWTLFGLLLAMIVLHIVLSELNHRKRRAFSSPVSIVISIVVAVLFSRMVGPFMLVPGIVTVFAIAWMSFPTIVGRPWPSAIGMLVAMVVPIALEAAGVLSPTWSIEGGAIRTTSEIITLDGPITGFLLISATLGIIVVALIYGRGLAVTRRDALRKVEIQAWHLRKLLPAER